MRGSHHLILGSTIPGEFATSTQHHAVSSLFVFTAAVYISHTSRTRVSREVADPVLQVSHCRLMITLSQLVPTQTAVPGWLRRARDIGI